MEDKDLNLYARCESVPYIVHEADMARLENSMKQTNKALENAMGAANKRYFIVVVLLILALIGSWAFFFIYENQFETVTETTVQDVWQDANLGGINRFVGGDSYGETEGENGYDTDVPASEESEP